MTGALELHAQSLREAHMSHANKNQYLASRCFRQAELMRDAGYVESWQDEMRWHRHYAQMARNHLFALIGEKP